MQGSMGDSVVCFVRRLRPIVSHQSLMSALSDRRCLVDAPAAPAWPSSGEKTNARQLRMATNARPTGTFGPGSACEKTPTPQHAATAPIAQAASAFPGTPLQCFTGSGNSFLLWRTDANSTNVVAVTNLPSRLTRSSATKSSSSGSLRGFFTLPLRRRVRGGSAR